MPPPLFDRLSACPHCGCHVKRSETQCPHCDEEIERTKEGAVGPTAVALLVGLTAVSAGQACGDDTTSTESSTSSTASNVGGEGGLITVSAYGVGASFGGDSSAGGNTGGAGGDTGGAGGDTGGAGGS